jgi:hypothetical protein
MGTAGGGIHGGADPPGHSEGFAGRQPAQAVAGVEGVRRAGHRFDGHGLGPARELAGHKHMDERARFVLPQADGAAVRRRQRVAGNPAVELQICQGDVDVEVPHFPPVPQVAVGADGFGAAGNEPVIRHQPCRGADRQGELFAGRFAEAEIRMRAQDEGRVGLGIVDQRLPDHEPQVVGQRILHAVPHQERISVLGEHGGLKGHRELGFRDQRVRRIAQEPVAGVVPRDLRDVQLLLLAVKVPDAVLNPVGPGRQRDSRGSGRDVRVAVRLGQLDAGAAVPPESRGEFGDHRERITAP